LEFSAPNRGKSLLQTEGCNAERLGGVVGHASPPEGIRLFSTTLGRGGCHWFDKCEPVGLACSPEVPGLWAVGTDK
jgi:hypothetical protein